MQEKERIVDGKLVADFQSGNKQALITLVKRWHKIFCDKAYWIVKDADMAKDIAQDCWQTIIDKLETLKDPESFGAWAMRIVYTKSIDAIKIKNKTGAIDNQLEQESIEEVESTYMDNLKQNLLKTVNTLPEHQQMVVRLFYVQDYSLKEISGILEISIGTAKSRLYHAREKLKTIIKSRSHEN
ncbi:RNA polymerase sigma factor [Flagellimonas pacifica]|uniref:RNA polymerase sigma-70 factor, ECF subfamily n=1 Tax=Flagellimonas pacifica TaxID=1247520 RepID=A0A285MQB9_9FLAO|nr:RNA polymerase sigma factor [Allomuricauda parva]SNY99379.1 RNA polymerase sigma-70 factor, ECF subfamily [Allomuricauda parva]